MRPLVIVRPEPGAGRTAQAARALGLQAFVRPLFEIVPIPSIPPDPGDFDALLLTSANAVRHGGVTLSSFAHLPVAAVGAATAAAARSKGLSVVAVGSGGIDALLADLPPSWRLLHLCGQDRIAPADAEQPITSVTVYKAQRQTIDTRHLIGAIVALHSPRAAATLAEWIEMPDRSSIGVVALSPAVAAAAGLGWERVACPGAPSDTALLALASQLCL